VELTPIKEHVRKKRVVTRILQAAVTASLLKSRTEMTLIFPGAR
jgi:hypothetical protein